MRQQASRYKPYTAKQPGVIRIDADLFPRIDVLAQKEDRAISAMVNRLIRAGIAAYEKQAKSVPKIDEE